jgi:hypothetical protein
MFDHDSTLSQFPAGKLQFEGAEAQYAESLIRTRGYQQSKTKEKLTPQPLSHRVT